MTISVGGFPQSVTQQSSADYWNAAAVNMGNVNPGTEVTAEAQFGGWTLNATYPIDMVKAPGWLLDLFTYASDTGAIKYTLSTSGAGPYNKTYSLAYSFSWNIGKTFNFSIPVPLVSGNYSLIPSITVGFGVTSKGNVTLSGGFTLTTPAIALGPFSLKISAAVALKGTFALALDGSNIQTIDWLSASVTLTITGTFSASIPIYGFSFNLFGDPINIGFTLQITVAPSIALSFILIPTQNTQTQIIGNLGVELTKILGSFTLPLTAAVNFGIGIASVSFGGTLSVALAMELDPTIEVVGGWVNGSIQVGAQFLFWSGSFNLVGPGTIYHWAPGPTAPRSSAMARMATAPNVTWVLNARYYKGAGYDAPVWNGTASSGPAISDIYPQSEVSAAAGSNGAYLFYSDDNVSQPVNQGLTISGGRLDPTTNHWTAVPAPVDPGFLVTRPSATTLSNGTIAVVWDALPTSEEGASGPTGLSELALHAATFDPSTGRWGVVRDLTNWGIAQSSVVDPTGADGRVVALVTSSVAIGTTTPEHLLEFDAGTGAVVSNSTVTGLAEVVSSRGASDWAVVRGIDGNDSLESLSKGTIIPLVYSPPSGSGLLSEAFVTGSASELALLYREAASSQAVLLNASTGATVATLPLTGNVSELQAIASGSSSYLFASSPSGIEGWEWTGGAWANVTNVSRAGIESFGAVQDGGSILLYDLARTGGNSTAPIETLDLAEVGAGLPAVPSPGAAPGAKTGGSSSSVSTLDLAIVLAVLAIVDALLLVVVLLRRRTPRAPTSAPSTSPAPPPATEPPPPTAPTPSPPPPTAPPPGPPSG